MLGSAKARSDAVKKSAIEDIVDRVRRVDETWLTNGGKDVVVNAFGKTVATSVLSGVARPTATGGSAIDISGMVACRRLLHLLEYELLSTFLQSKITPPPTVRRGRRSLTKEELANQPVFRPASTALYDMLSGDGSKWAEFVKMQVLIGPSMRFYDAEGVTEDCVMARSWSYDMKPRVDILDGVQALSKKPVLHVLMPEDFSDEEARVFLECVFRDFD